MIAERSRGLFAVHTGLQLVLVVIGFWLWIAVFTHAYVAPPIDVRRYTVYCLLTAGALLARAAFATPAQRAVLRQRVRDRLGNAIHQTLCAAAALFLFLVAAKDAVISRVFIFTWLPVLYAILAATNAGLPGLLARRLFAGSRVERTLLYVLEGAAENLAPWLERQQAIGIQVIGVVTDRPLEGRLRELPVLGGTEEVEYVLHNSGATQLLVTELPMFGNITRFLGRLCEARGVRLLVLSDLEARFGLPVTIVEEDGIEFITLRAEPLENPLNRLVKRALDLAVSIPVVFGLLPLVTGLVWLLQRWQSPGPVFYRQPRAGLQNRTFEILKYRTMHVHNGDPALQARVGDDRIFAAGRWMRRLSIDELPQFINVLRGEMSVVGPRPHLAEHNGRWAGILRNYHVRAFVKPGITGLAQVRGFRGEATDDDAIRGRVLSDIDYLENWSITLDCLIICRTVWQVLRPPRTAY